MATDRQGNEIGNGDYHVSYSVLDFSDYPEITISVEKSETTESVYVTYAYQDKRITCRFSDHENNAVKFGDQLNGNFATNNEVLFHLGIISRKFVPNTFLSITKQMVKKSLMDKYEEAELTIQEMYALGDGANISAFVGKLAKGSNWLIQGSRVQLIEQKKRNALGGEVVVGTFIYE